MTNNGEFRILGGGKNVTAMDAEAPQGKTGDVRIVIDNPDTVAGIQLKLKFDALKLEYQSYTIGSLFATWSKQVVPKPGVISLATASATPLSQTTEADIITITFKAIGNPGDVVPLLLENVYLSDGDGNLLDVQTHNGEFTILSGSTAPTVVSATPNALGQGASGIDVVIAGTNFQSGASVIFSGTGITVNSTQVDSSTQIAVNVSVATDAPIGSVDITVTNPDSQSGTGTGIFTVNPAPTITTLSPAQLPQGAMGQDVTIEGDYFQNGASVSFSGIGITVNSTTFISVTQINVNISIDATAPLGNRDVTVINPDYGVGVKTDAFTVITQLVVDAGEDKTICHPNNGGSVQIGGNPTASGGTPPYNYIWEPAGSLDNVNIANPIATPTETTTYTVTVTDSSAPPQQGSDTVTVTVYPELIANAGDDKSINSGDTVQIGGSPTASGGTPGYTYNWQPADTLDDAASSNPNATPTETTTYTVTVTDAHGCVDTDDTTVTVEVVSTPTVVNATPNALGQGANCIDVVIAGTNFQSGASVAFSNPKIIVNSTKVDSDTQITVNVSVTADAPTGSCDITVTNPDSQSGTGIGIFTVNPAPTITRLEPDSGQQGATNLNVTIEGSNFQAGAFASWEVSLNIQSGAIVLGPRIFAFDENSTDGYDPGLDIPHPPLIGDFNAFFQVPGDKLQRDTRPSSPWLLSVLNTTGAGFTISWDVSSVPVSVELSLDGVNMREQSSQTFPAGSRDIIITATLSTATLSVFFSGTGITINSITFVSATEIQINISVSATAPLGSRNVTVTNPDFGIGSKTDAFSVIPPSSSAIIKPIADSPQLSGAEFTVDIKVENVKNLFGVAFVLHYTHNTDYIDALSAVKGDFLGSDVIWLDPVIDDVQGTVSIGITRKRPASGVDGSGVIAKVKFKSDSTTPDGTSVTFTITEIAANDPLGTPILLTPESGTVMILSICVWPGDTNNDGKVNQADVLPLGLHWARTGPARPGASSKWECQIVEPWNPEAATYADANGDCFSHITIRET